MAELFDRDVRTINEHIKDVYKSAELSQNRTIRKFRIVQIEGKRQVERDIEHYNLDMIISVGYRVNSKRGTEFRIWATKHLRDYILKGYLINEMRLRENQNLKLRELSDAHKLIQEALETKRLDGFEKELFNIISDYAHTWSILNEYDSGKLKISEVTKKPVSYLEYGRVKDSVQRFQKRLLESKQATSSFGIENGRRLAKVLDKTRQGMDGLDLYPSAEEKAAHLFYTLVTDKPFLDGNKRIASLVFVLFLIENHLLYNRSGQRKINDSALAALALLVAESKPTQKDIMIKLIVNLINKK
jgi:prophage maintenance system killer protein